MQKRVREVFQRLGAEMSASGNDINDDGTKKWVVVDAGRERETVADELWHLVEPLTKGIDGDIGKLWEDKLIS